MAKFGKKNEKSRVQLARNPFFGGFKIPEKFRVTDPSLYDFDN